MKDKKTIAYKDERIKKIAFNLRKLLTKVVMDEWSRLGETQKNKSTIEYIKIENVRSNLRRALHASICICPGCHQIERDMVYNAYLEEWYCTFCDQAYRDFYLKKKADIDKGWSVGDFGIEFHKSFL